METIKYIDIYRGSSPKDWQESVDLEKIGNLLLMNFDENKEHALNFINRVEAWKAMGIPERIIGIGSNTDEQAQDVIKNAITSKESKLQIESFHKLRGFGSSLPFNHQTRPAKVASAAMRFLLPEKWGVVDWRSGSVANELIRNNFDVEATVKNLKNEDKKTLKDVFLHIDSQWAVKINDQYREIGHKLIIKNNAEVDQFLFGISLEIWPIKKGSCGTGFETPSLKFCRQ